LLNLRISSQTIEYGCNGCVHWFVARHSSAAAPVVSRTTRTTVLVEKPRRRR
jgi:hypothetical protein